MILSASSTRVIVFVSSQSFPIYIDDPQIQQIEFVVAIYSVEIKSNVHSIYTGSNTVSQNVTYGADLSEYFTVRSNLIFYELI